MSKRRSKQGTASAVSVMRDVRQNRRDALKAAGALTDAYRSTRGRTIPSGKRYDRRAGKAVPSD